ncbi:transporter, partial [Candidatus Endoriftia persephone str. Guaymas]|nr:transporter [Candidatus Endoriftia persephone str. Guaymas]
SLIRHVETFMKKFAHVLVPTVGAVQQSGKLKELQDLLFSAAKYAAALALTMMIPFVVFGDVLMQVWMGSDYVNIPLIVLLGCGFFLPISQQPSFRFLMGMNEHGYIAMRAALAFVASLSIGIPILNSIGWSLDRAAWIVLVPELLAYGILVPIHASRVLQIPLWRYLHRAFGVPLLCALPYLLTLLGIKMAMPESPVSAMGYGALAGGLVLFVMFWLLLFPEKVKRKFQKLIPTAAR